MTTNSPTPGCPGPSCPRCSGAGLVDADCPGPAAGARVEELLIAQRGPVQERLVHLLYRFATDVCGIANDDAEKYANEVVTDCLWRTGIRGTDMGEECGRFARAFAAALRERDAARERGGGAA